MPTILKQTNYRREITVNIEPKPEHIFLIFPSRGELAYVTRQYAFRLMRNRWPISSDCYMQKEMNFVFRRGPGGNIKKMVATKLFLAV